MTLRYQKQLLLEEPKADFFQVGLQLTINKYLLLMNLVIIFLINFFCLLNVSENVKNAHHSIQKQTCSIYCQQAHIIGQKADWQLLLFLFFSQFLSFCWSSREMAPVVC